MDYRFPFIQNWDSLPESERVVLEESCREVFGYFRKSSLYMLIPAEQTLEAAEWFSAFSPCFVTMLSCYKGVNMFPFPGFVGFYCGNPELIPAGWLECDHSLLNIEDYPALYEAIGTYYGGDGVNNFRLPGGAGRVIIGRGAGSGLTERVLAEEGGYESVSLATYNLPSHEHKMRACLLNSESPVDVYYGVTGGSTPYRVLQGVDGNISSPTALNTGSAGGDVPHSNLQPFIVLCMIVCTDWPE